MKRISKKIISIILAVSLIIGGGSMSMASAVDAVQVLETVGLSIVQED